ncbi:hypothetical protein IV203_020057 [Nitzschia inconspicua]|uniref:Uncharacterized protein n=1 Tax=Nitzschia inconspicua TaxID=303405 RepID=A0A9K3Q4W1_9STRA|nr:hypothetical protein IV203_020057 [Nitzschia inconspicua]
MPDHEDQDPNFDAEEAVRVLRTNTISPNSVQVAEFALSSVVWHVEFLEQTLPSNHRLFFTPLFRGQDQLIDLKNLVTSRLNSPGDSIVATGVPPDISILQHMHSLANNVNDVVPQIQKVAPEVIRGVIDEIEKRAMTIGTVTRDGLEALLSG